MSISIRRLTPERLDDFLSFFDHRAFEDNPDWQGCYCVFFHHPGDEASWLRRTKRENRDRAIELIGSGALDGFLAYRAGEPIGWCNANEKRRLSFNINRREVLSAEDQDIVSVVCFAIYHRARREGVAQALLDHVISHYAGQGKRIIEAYPLREGAGGIHYHGPLSLYLKRGFAIHHSFGDYLVVRRGLD